MNTSLQRFNVDMNILLNVGTSLHLLNVEDESEITTIKQQWGYFLSSSVLYESILSNAVAVKNYLGFPSISIAVDHILQHHSLPAFPIHHTDNTDFTKRLFTAIVKLIENMKTLYDTDDDESKESSNIEKTKFLRVLVLFHANDLPWLIHYRTVLLDTFDWERLMVGKSISEVDYWCDEIEFLTVQDCYIDDFDPLQNSRDKTNRKNYVMLSVWTDMATLFRTTQVILLLADRALAEEGSNDKSSGYNRWLSILSQHLPTVCHPSNLFAMDDMNSDNEHILRLKAEVYIITIGNSVLSPLITPALTQTASPYQSSIVTLQTTLIEHCFLSFHNQPSNWCLRLIQERKSYVLEAITTCFNPLVYDSTSPSATTNAIAWLVNQFPYTEELLSAIASVFQDMQIFASRLRESLKLYRSSIQSMWNLISSNVPSASSKRHHKNPCIFDHSFTYQHTTYPSLAHFIIQEMYDETNNSHQENFGRSDSLLHRGDLLTILREAGANMNAKVDSASNQVPLLLRLVYLDHSVSHRELILTVCGGHYDTELLRTFRATRQRLSPGNLDFRKKEFLHWQQFSLEKSSIKNDIHLVFINKLDS